MFPITIWQLTAQRAAEHQVAWFVAGLFVLTAVPISVHDGTSQHVTPQLMLACIAPRIGCPSRDYKDICSSP